MPAAVRLDRDRGIADRIRTFRRSGWSRRPCCCGASTCGSDITSPGLRQYPHRPHRSNSRHSVSGPWRRCRNRACGCTTTATAGHQSWWRGTTSSGSTAVHRWTCAGTYGSTASRTIRRSPRTCCSSRSRRRAMNARQQHLNDARQQRRTVPGRGRRCSSARQYSATRGSTTISRCRRERACSIALRGVRHRQPAHMETIGSLTSIQTSLSSNGELLLLDRPCSSATALPGWSIVAGVNTRGGAHGVPHRATKAPQLGSSRCQSPGRVTRGAARRESSVVGLRLHRAILPAESPYSIVHWPSVS